MRSSVLLCAIGAVCLFPPAQFAAGLEVRESAISVRFADRSARIQFEVAADQPFPARLTADWLDPQERVVARAASNISLKKGAQTVELSTSSPLGPYSSANEVQAFALRLRYSFAGPGGHVEHIASLSALRSNLFLLEPKLPDEVSRSRPVRFTVRAADPLGVGVAGALIRATVKFGDDAKPVEQSAILDTTGKATFEFPWPPGTPDDLEEIAVVIEADSGDVHRSAKEEIDVNSKPTLYTSTDKALYQPGQTLHMRAIAFDFLNHAMSGASLQFRIYKDYHDLKYTATATATRFGVAAADWAIPERFDTGDYRIDVVLGNNSQGSAQRHFRISRYELPTFEFTAKPSADHANPGETIAVLVDAKYLFGSPLKTASVMIEGQPAQYWKGKENQSITPDGAEADLDTNGRAQLELKIPEFDDFAKPWAITYRAVVTEAGTERQEERTFEIRLQAGGLWLTISNARQSLKQPRILYVRARRWNGEPCIDCTLELSEFPTSWEHGKERKGEPAFIARVKTNRAGIAQVPNYKSVPKPDWASYMLLHAEADDSAGTHGGQYFWMQASAGVDGHIEASRFIYRAGEPIHLTVESPDSAGRSVTIGVVRDYQQLDTFQIALDNRGKADFTYPFEPLFGDHVTFVLASGREAEDAEILDQLTVFSQPVAPLQVDVSLDRAEYRPGGPIAARLQVHTKEGQPVEAAIGVSAIDRAVIVRARGSEQVDENRVVDDRTWRRSLQADDSLTPEDQSHLRYLSREQVLWESQFAGPSLDLHFQPAFQPWLMTRLEPFRIAAQAAIKGGEPIPYNEASLKIIWRKAGLNWDATRDPWGRPFSIEFHTTPADVHCKLSSTGPNGPHHYGAGLQFDLFDANWFATMDAKLRKQIYRSKHLPATRAEFEAVWKAAGLTVKDRLTPQGTPIDISFDTVTMPGVRTTVYEYAQYDPKRARQSGLDLVHSLPVTRIVVSAKTESNRYTYPVTLATYIESSPHRPDLTVAKPRPFLKLTGKSGISGVVNDASGSVIPNATVTLSDASGDKILSVKTGMDGNFIFYGLPLGSYTVDAQSPGFNGTRISSVPVKQTLLTPLSIVLQVGTVSETVEVSAEAPLLQTESAMVALEAAPVDEPDPRLRKEFLETLLWQPLLETDSQGRATVAFNAADNITTWAFTAIGSTLDGRVGTGESDIRVFQPFFIEHTPPPVLTAGDELWLPVTLRNYLKSDQDVKFKVNPGNWFDLASPSESAVHVAAGGTAQQTVQFTATKPTREGTQRITAIGPTESDAIEKKIEVRPYGYRVDSAATELFNSPSALVIDIPQNADAINATLKLRPDAASHIFEAEVAMLERPWGCGEQTISSTYPSVLILSHAGASAADLAKARRYLRLGYDRLLGFRLPDGGFAYFKGQPADLAITAYAIEFLSAAAGFIDVDKVVIEDALVWLGKQQNGDGTWGSRYAKSDVRHTAYLAGVIATLDPANRKTIDLAVQALTKLDLTSDPYTQAHLLKIYHKLNDQRSAADAARVLEKLAQPDREGGVHWDQHGAATPFYGWGRAGAIETTAVVVRALLDAGCSLELARKGLAFLLRAQDSRGAWYSTQATIRALDALLAARTSGVPNGSLHATLNGAHIDEGSIALKPGRNEIQLGQIANFSLASATVSASYYLPWTDIPKPTHDLKLSVDFDRTIAKAGEPIECRVKAERGKGNYGMMIAEIGLPPGVEIDRTSLNSARFIYKYEVQPDRLILYFWSPEQTIDFRFRARFPMQAWQAGSVLYDYYNPDARAVVAPVRFSIVPK